MQSNNFNEMNLKKVPMSNEENTFPTQVSSIEEKKGWKENLILERFKCR